MAELILVSYFIYHAVLKRAIDKLPGARINGNLP